MDRHGGKTTEQGHGNAISSTNEAPGKKTLPADCGTPNCLRFNSKLVGLRRLFLSSRIPRPTFTSSIGRGEAHSTHNGLPCRPSSTLAFTLHLGPPMVAKPPVASGTSQLVRGRAALLCASRQLAVCGVRRRFIAATAVPGLTVRI